MANTNGKTGYSDSDNASQSSGTRSGSSNTGGSGDSGLKGSSTNTGGSDRGMGDSQTDRSTGGDRGSSTGDQSSDRGGMRGSPSQGSPDRVRVIAARATADRAEAIPRPATPAARAGAIAKHRLNEKGRLGNGAPFFCVARLRRNPPTKDAREIIGADYRAAWTRSSMPPPFCRMRAQLTE
jgi:hypothetical protein